MILLIAICLPLSKNTDSLKSAIQRLILTFSHTLMFFFIANDVLNNDSEGTNELLKAILYPTHGCVVMESILTTAPQ